MTAPHPACGLHVGLDLSCAAKEKPSGIARYALALVDALARAGGPNRYRLLYRLSRIKRRRHFLEPPSPAFERAVFAETLARFQLRGLDVVHGLDARIPRCGVPAVATIHDLFSAQRDDLGSDDFRRKKLATYEHTAKRAARIVVPTRAVAVELVERFPAATGRVRVVPHGVDDVFFDAAPDDGGALGIDGPYVLFVGLLSTRKNVVRLVEAFDRLAGDHPDLKLVLAGPASHGFESIQAAIGAATARARIVRPGFVPPEALPSLYAGAEALAFATLQEGFGLPILEAFAAGTRVLASDQATPREVGGDAAVYVDPEDAGAIEGGLRALLDEPAGARADRRDRGRARARELTWARCAERTAEVWREAAECG